MCAPGALARSPLTQATARLPTPRASHAASNSPSRSCSSRGKHVDGDSGGGEPGDGPARAEGLVIKMRADDER